MRMSLIKRIVLCLSLLLVVAGAAAAQSKVRVKFAAGASAATMKGKITGYRYVDYLVGARAGQTLSVSVGSSNRFTQLVVFGPSMENLDGATGVAEWSGELPASGDYTVRVLFPRAEARRRTAVADYSLRIAVR